MAGAQIRPRFLYLLPGLRIMRAPSSVPLLIVFSVVIGVAVSSVLLFLCLSDAEIACRIQMPAFLIGDALGFGVHGGLYLFGLLLDTLIFATLCFSVLFLIRRSANKRISSGRKSSGP
jgi:hypothetical protein